MVSQTTCSTVHNIILCVIQQSSTGHVGNIVVGVRFVTAITRMKRDEGQEENEPQNDQATGDPITHTSIELQEPLLEEQ